MDEKKIGPIKWRWEFLPVDHIPKKRKKYNVKLLEKLGKGIIWRVLKKNFCSRMTIISSMKFLREKYRGAQ